MNLMGLVLVALLLITLSINGKGYLYDPHAQEIEDALHFQKPSKSWGFQARTERNLRLVCIGGSNTEQKLYSKPLSAYLSNSSAHLGWTAVLESQGLGGISPLNYLGALFDFERRPPKTWPNVVLFDFSMNTYGQVKTEKIAETIDAVIRTISFKYVKNGLQVPDYMFLELFFVKHCINFINERPMSTAEERIRFLNGNITIDIDDENKFGVSRGCPSCKEIQSVADFYDYPTVSWRRLSYAAFIRYFLTEQFKAVEHAYQTNKWRYTSDGLHITLEGGKLLSDTLFEPFFADIMTPRKELPENERHSLPTSMQMFPSKLQSMQLVAHVMWDSNRDTTLASIVRQPSGWKSMAHAEDVLGMREGKMCMGTSTQNDGLELNFVVPRVCNVLGDCKVSIGFLHSWNTSFIGGLSCDLIQKLGNKMLVKNQVIETHLLEDGRPMKHTGAISTVLDAPVREGNHTVRCRKLDSRFSCLVMLYTSAMAYL